MTKQRGSSKPNRITLWQRIRRCFRPIKPVLVKMHLVREGTPDAHSFPGSAGYWEKRYADGGNSGDGSYGQLAEWKAGVINEFIRTRDVKSVIDFGAGDGHQLSLLKVNQYIGLDVSRTAIGKLAIRFATDESKRFVLYDQDMDPAGSGLRGELALSLDVIYHLIEHSVFEKYMRDLFAAPTRFVIIYSSNDATTGTAAHVRDRRFTDFVAEHCPEWSLMKVLKNPHKDRSRSDFFVYERVAGRPAQ